MKGSSIEEHGAAEEDWSRDSWDGGNLSSPRQNACNQPRKAATVGMFDPNAFVNGNATVGNWRPRAADLNSLMQESVEDEELRRSLNNQTYAAVAQLNADSENETKLPTRSTSWCLPELQSWLMSRIGNSSAVVLVLSCILVECAKFLMEEKGYTQSVNMMSIQAVSYLGSTALALVSTAILEKEVSLWRILGADCHRRYMLAMSLFAFGIICVVCAWEDVHASWSEIRLVGYTFLPLAVVMSYFAFGRKYGILEWLAVGMMTLSILAFVWLRERAAGSAMRFSLRAGVLVQVGVSCCVAGSIIVERTLKRRFADGQTEPVSLQMAQCSGAASVIAVLLWITTVSLGRWHIPGFSELAAKWTYTQAWFGEWGFAQLLLTFVLMCHNLITCLILKTFSTVIRAVMLTLALVFVMMLGDWAMGGRYYFAVRLAPSLILATIILLSAVVFQTGRLNLKEMRKVVLHGLDEAAGSNDDKSDEDFHEVKEAERATTRTSMVEMVSSICRRYASTAVTDALILIYVLTDCGRTIVVQKTLQNTAINSTSLGLICYILGALVASGLTLQSHGLDGLREAWSIDAILRCLPAAFLFALATCLGNLAFASGISSALYMVLGKFYTPVAALGARWVMGKFYLWLEWMALIILTLASVCFGYLKKYSIETGIEGAPVTAMVLVLGAASVSAVASLVTERILKNESAPFHMQKVRLDVGSILSSAVLLPVIGLIATRPQDVPWVSRPTDYATCPANSPCWDLSSGACGGSSCAGSCPCTNGLFAGWTTPWLALTVLINTLQGWLVGKVTQRFSVVHRAIADSFSLLTLYFVGDPVFNHTSLSDMGLNLVAMIVPLSTAAFSFATIEMQKVVEAQQALEYASKGHRLLETVDTDFSEPEHHQDEMSLWNPRSAASV